MPFTLQEVERMIREGEIKDATTVAARGLFRPSTGALPQRS
jgi:hypothetical protein